MSLFTKKTSFDSSKCVSLLELTLQRIKILRNKKLIIAKQSRDDVAKLLQKGQDANAAARVEHVFREENIARAYDLLEQYCQLIIKRIRILKSGKECPPELKEAIASLIYAAPRCGDLLELQKLRDLLTSKCGDDYSSAALEKKPEGYVNHQIIGQLSGRLPNSDIRLNLLKAIAGEYKIDWNYQKAAAIFKNGEASMQDKQKVKSQNQVLKLADVDKEKLPAPAPLRQEDDVIPSQSVNNHSETGEATDAPKQPPITDKGQTPYSSVRGETGYESHASAAAQTSRGLTTHSRRPKPEESLVASKKALVGSPTSEEEDGLHDVPKHQVSSSHNEDSLQAYAETVPSRPSSRRKDHAAANPITGPGLNAGPTKGNASVISTREDELQGQQRLVNPTKNLSSSCEGKGFVSPGHMGVPKASSVERLQDELVESDNSDAPHSTALRPKPRPKPGNLNRLPGRRLQESPQRRELKEHTPSTGGFHDTKVLSPKLSHHLILDGEAGDITESLAATQYMRAYKNYIKTNTMKGEEDLKHMENTGVNVRANHEAELSHIDPYIKLRQEGRMDYKYGQGRSKEYRTPESIHKEEDMSPHKNYGREQAKASDYYAGEQHKGALSQLGLDGLSHQHPSSVHMSEERIWSGKHDHSSQSRHPAEVIYNRNPLTLPELTDRHAARSLVAPLKHGKELGDLEASAETAYVSAAHAADAARAAIDMVRLNSMRFTDTGNEQDKQKTRSRYRDQAYQDEETSSYHSEMPHFDDYCSSHESSDDDLAIFYTKRSTAAAREDDDAQENRSGTANKHSQSMSPFVRDTIGSDQSTHLSVKKSLEPDFLASLDSVDCAESVDFLNPNSSRSPLYLSDRSGVYHSHRPQFNRRDEQSDKAIGWISAAPKKSHASGSRLNTSTPSEAAKGTDPDHGGRQGLVSSVPGRAPTDSSKQRWKLTNGDGVDAGHPSVARAALRDHPAQGSQAYVGKYAGVSRKSVRSTRLL